MRNIYTLILIIGSFSLSAATIPTAEEIISTGEILSSDLLTTPIARYFATATTSYRESSSPTDHIDDTIEWYVHGGEIVGGTDIGTYDSYFQFQLTEELDHSIVVKWDLDENVVPLVAEPWIAYRQIDSPAGSSSEYIPLCSVWSIEYVDISILGIEGVATPPTVINDTLPLLNMNPIVVYPLDNDFDVDSNMVNSTLKIIMDPVYGEAMLNIDSLTITYIAGAESVFNGFEEIQYVVYDETGLPGYGSIFIDWSQRKIRIPEAFTPNGDGINDFLVVENIDIATDREIIIYNHSGTMIYSNKHYGGDDLTDWWDGSLSEGHTNSVNLVSNTYFMVLKLDGVVYKNSIYVEYN